MYCSTAISKFLSLHAKDILSVEKSFFPLAFSAQLYAANPTRIILYDADSILEYKVQ